MSNNRLLNNSILSNNRLNMSGEANNNERMARLSEKLGKITVTY